MKSTYSLAFAALAALGSCHTIFTQLETGGTLYSVSQGVRTPSYDGPITDVTSDDVACNGASNGGGADVMSTDDILEVTAGSTVKATWRHTLTSDSSDVIDSSHVGPVMAYLKKVDDATTAEGAGSGWFKISEQGYDASTATWAVTDLIANGGVQDIPIPSCIEDGQYLLRAELIALHGASSSGGAQLYMECAQINISGGTAATSPSTVSFPGAYSASDPGILINIYYPTVTSYDIPGPTPLSC